MNDQPLVSILIPCYNHEAFLADCLESILQQTYENIELLICDDCSPDNSFAVIQSFAQKLLARFPRVELLRNEVNCGVTKNINRMLKMARGTLIKTLASDDAMAPTAIREFVNFLQANPDYDIAVANGIKVSEEQHYPHFASEEVIYEEAPDFRPEGFFERTARCNMISAPAAMVRMSVYETYGLYDEAVKIEDYEFWLRCLKDRQVRFGFLDRPVLYYRINSGSMTSVVGNSGLEKRRRLFHHAILDTLEKYRSFFAPGVFEEIALQHMLDEYSFTIDSKLTAWAAELSQGITSFPGWRKLAPSTRMRFLLRWIRMELRKVLKP